jgi:Tol biopolymer transport system component
MDVWIFDVAQGIQMRLPTSASLDNSPIWSPTGDRIAWISGTWGGDQNLVSQRSDGVGPLDTLVLGAYTPIAWTPDGRQIVCVSNGQLFVADIGDRHARPKLFDVSSKVFFRARLSRDGKYLAYVSAETGRREVYITPFPGGGRKWRGSTAGGILPGWTDGGKELVYLQGGMIWSVRFADHAGVVVSDSRALFSPDTLRGFLYDFSQRAFDPAPDGQHFAVVTEAESDDREPSIILLENWQAGMGGGKKP